MKHLIDNRIVEEIERQIELLKPFLGACAGQVLAEANAKLSVLEGLKNFIKTLEVKEVANTPNIRFPHYKSIVEKVFGAGNLESFEYDEAEQLVSLAKEELLKDLEMKEVDLETNIQDYINSHFTEGEDGVMNSDYFTVIGGVFYKDLKEIAKHFFELGLKAQKGE